MCKNGVSWCEGDSECTKDPVLCEKCEKPNEDIPEACSDSIYIDLKKVAVHAAITSKSFESDGNSSYAEELRNELRIRKESNREYERCLVFTERPSTQANIADYEFIVCCTFCGYPAIISMNEKIKGKSHMYKETCIRLLHYRIGDLLNKLGRGADDDMYARIHG
jgi:hypothetical protein